MFFLGKAVDSTFLCTVSATASESAKPTKHTLAQTKQLFDYISTQEEAVLTYNASNLKFPAHGYTSYLSKPKA